MEDLWLRSQFEPDTDISNGTDKYQLIALRADSHPWSWTSSFQRNQLTHLSTHHFIISTFSLYLYRANFVFPFPIFSLQAIQASERCFLGFSLFCTVRYPLSFFAIASYTIPFIFTPLYLYTHIPHRSFLERIHECWIVRYGIYGLGKAFCSFIDFV